MDNNTILNIYDCYKRAMAEVGWRIQLPAHTEPSKTYAYRAISKFIEQTQEWKLDEEVTKTLVREVVKYGKKNGLLNKGTALLNMKNILQICHDYLQNETTRVEHLVKDLRRSKEFLSKYNDELKTLVTRMRTGGYSNLTQWYKSGDLSLSFISISANCRRALSMLPPDERMEFPSDIVLLRNRIKILQNSETRRIISKILSSDLLLTGVALN